MNRMLLIVDAQNDFIDGSLGVNGAKEKMNHLIEYVKNNKDKYECIAFTCDWHPIDHMSFSVWPIHCVQHTIGAAIYDPLFKAICELNIPFNVLIKGDNPLREDYSIMNHPESKGILRNIINVTRKITDIDVCGIANEYCVNDSVKDIANDKIINSNINVLFDYVAAIKDENVLKNTCKELNINVICS